MSLSIAGVRMSVPPKDERSEYPRSSTRIITIFGLAAWLWAAERQIMMAVSNVRMADCVSQERNGNRKFWTSTTKQLIHFAFDGLVHLDNRRPFPLESFTR